MTIPAAEISHWFAQLHGDAPVPERPPLAGDHQADVCIVGAGYTGLWTAYELCRAQPGLDVVVLEAAVAGYGASGRNGGAVIAQLNGSRAYWSARGGRDGAIAMERAVQAAVDEVGAAVEREGIDCAYAKNGVLMAARTALELRRFAASVQEDREWGFGTEDSELLGPEEAAAHVRVAGMRGARFSPHCASMHPGRLVRGLAEAAERAGATICERTPVTRIEPGAAVTERGRVRARVVVRATEAYTATLDGHARTIVPVHTSMLVTEPLGDEIWEEIGWAGRAALLAEHPFLHLQHTADGRITIGGDDNRVPYRFRSRPSPDGAATERVARMYRSELARLFPVLRDVRIERTWQGVFGASRAWAPGVGLDRASGLAWAGGYVGEGVAASNLAGRTLRDLILERDTELTRLPWVGPPARGWEPEPLRLIGATACWGMRALGDSLERHRDRPSRLAALGTRIAGYQGHLG